jgi:hypothetical protein
LRADNLVRACSLLGALLALSFAPAIADAGFVPAFTGNAVTAGGYQVHFSTQSTASYAVYANGGGDWRTQLGLTSSDVQFSSGSAAGPTAKVVFFYELVNNDGLANPVPLTKLDLPVDPSLVTSYGCLWNPTLNQGYVFHEKDTGGNDFGPVNGANPALGTAASGFPLTSTNPFSAAATAVKPDADDFTLGANYLEVGFIPSGIGVTQNSTIVFFTTDVTTASFKESAVHGADSMSTANAPTVDSSGIPVPEPFTLTLLLPAGAIVGAAAIYRRRRAC